MIKPQDKVFANLSHQLQRDLPQEPLTRLVNLAAVALGILGSKSLQVGQIITALPLAGARDSLKKRVQRFLKNEGVSVEAYYQPLAKRILRRLVTGGARVHLTLDRTEWGVFNILYVCVGWRGRAAAVVADEPTCKVACVSYAKRFRIEEMFKDFKNTGRGFGLELTGLRHPERLARLLLALVYTWVLLWGAYVLASGQQKLVDNVRRPPLSLLQTGLRFVLQLWHRSQLVRFHWHLSMLAEANN